MNTINRSKGERLFHQQYTYMSDKGMICYPEVGDDRDVINNFYLDEVFPNMIENQTYVLCEVYLSTIFEVLDTYVDVDVYSVTKEYLDKHHSFREITDIPNSVDIASLSVDYIRVRKESGKISFERVQELQGSQHNIHNPSAPTVQFARDAVKAAVLEELGIECTYSNSEFAKCGVPNYERKVVKMECESFVN